MWPRFRYVASHTRLMCFSVAASNTGGLDPTSQLVALMAIYLYRNLFIFAYPQSHSGNFLLPPDAFPGIFSWTHWMHPPQLTSHSLAPWMY